MPVAERQFEFHAPQLTAQLEPEPSSARMPLIEF